MNYLSRMISSVTSNKRNTVVMLLVASVLSVVLLIAIAIRSTSIKSVEKIRSSMDTSVMVRTSASYSTDYLSSCQIPMEEVRKIEKLSNVKNASYYVRTLAYASNFKAQVLEAQTENEMKKKKKADYVPSYDIYIQGNSNSKDNDDFSNMASTLLIGKLISKEDDHVCIINYALAKDNNLALEDKITVKNAKGDQVSLTIIGLYYSSWIPDEEEMGKFDPYANQQNTVYTDVTSAIEISGKDAITLAQFGMKDPEKNKEFAKEVVEQSNFAKENYLFENQDISYRRLANSLKTIISITNIILAAIMSLGAIIITLLVIMAMRDRDYEIGILLSMGEKKYKIVLQLIGEQLIPILIGGFIGIFVDLALKGVINGCLSSVIDMRIGFSVGSIFAMFGAAIGLNVIGALITLYKVIWYQPRKALMHVE
ncbi:MAG: FtsX-like permease family protein [bacterium]|nr:FtsX-like permease family protein [bacterium]